MGGKNSTTIEIIALPERSKYIMTLGIFIIIYVMFFINEFQKSLESEKRSIMSMSVRKAIRIITSTALTALYKVLPIFLTINLIISNNST